MASSLGEGSMLTIQGRFETSTTARKSHYHLIAQPRSATGRICQKSWTVSAPPSCVSGYPTSCGAILDIAPVQRQSLDTHLMSCSAREVADPKHALHRL